MPLEQKAPGSTEIYLEHHQEIENWEKELEESLGKGLLFCDKLKIEF